jgi:transposase
LSSFPVVSLDPANLSLQHVDTAKTRATVFVQVTATEARCPLCNQPSERIHSRYVRKLADLPWQGQAVRIFLEVRRFFCLVSYCPRRIFAERLSFATAFARTTSRLRVSHTDIGLFLGGEAGARLARRLAMATSPDTLLRRIRQMPLPPVAPVRVLGIDDWAFRRGQRYGTILCDLERRCPVDLLPERSADALAQWLWAHPEVETITRDRADDYIKGATAGAPQAVQVADRWHLLQNLRDALREVVRRFHAKARQASKAARPGTLSLDTAAPSGGSPPEDLYERPRLTRYQERQQERRQRRLERYQQVKDLHQQGVAQREIGRRLGMNRATVRGLVRAESFPERAPRQAPRRTDQVIDYLQRRWNEGCRNAVQVFEELKARGFAGSYYMVRRRLARWRRRATGKDKAGSSGGFSYRRFSPRRLVWLLLKPEPDLNSTERALRDRLEQHDDGLRTAAELGRRFREMVRGRQAEAWDEWLSQSQQENTPEELRTFAKGLKEDEAAVRAALSVSWSNGQVEGQVNRLKTLKRQMYGRAKFDLLRKRFLLSA